MTKQRPKNSLVDRAKAMQKPRKSMWLDKLSNQDRDSLIELRKAWDGGEIDATSRQIFELVKAEIDLPITLSTFQGWLSEKGYA